MACATQVLQLLSPGGLGEHADPLVPPLHSFLTECSPQAWLQLTVVTGDSPPEAHPPCPQARPLLQPQCELASLICHQVEGCSQGCQHLLLLQSSASRI